MSFWRPGAEDWAAARVNLALAPGDYLYTGPNGRLELQVSAQGFVRAAADTELGLEDQANGVTQINVGAGEVSLDLRPGGQGETFVIAAPNGAFRIQESGYYRLIVTDGTARFAARSGGSARVSPADGPPANIGSGEEVVLEGTSGSVVLAAASGIDEWDRWNFERTSAALSSQSARYVPAGVYGVDTLDQYGTWRDEPRYGSVWVPRGVSSGWSPYSSGRWIWDAYYGWTWVDDAPWGWAPYHYGRWVNSSGYWGWAPGPAIVAPVYAPALVAFFGGGGFGVSVSVGTPFVSWVALGWGEPVIPWWGGRGFYGAPCWAGWGGPRVVNNVVINKTTIVNVTNINHYQNTRVRDAVVAVRHDQFARSEVARSRITHVNLRDLKPIAGRPPVETGSQGLVEAAGRGRRPPESLQQARGPASRNLRPGAERTAGARLQPGASDQVARLSTEGTTGARGASSDPAQRSGDRALSARHQLQSGTPDAARQLRTDRTTAARPSFEGSRHGAPPLPPNAAANSRQWHSTLEHDDRTDAVRRTDRAVPSRASIGDRTTRPERGAAPRAAAPAAPSSRWNQAPAEAAGAPAATANRAARVERRAPRVASRGDIAVPPPPPRWESASAKAASAPAPDSSGEIRPQPSRSVDARHALRTDGTPPQARRVERPAAVPAERYEPPMSRPAPAAPRVDRRADVSSADRGRGAPREVSAPPRFAPSGGADAQPDAGRGRPAMVQHDSGGGRASSAPRHSRAAGAQ